MSSSSLSLPEWIGSGKYDLSSIPAFLSGFEYKAGDAIRVANQVHFCTVDHTSAVFEIDKWARTPQGNYSFSISSALLGDPNADLSLSWPEIVTYLKGLPGTHKAIIVDQNCKVTSPLVIPRGFSVRFEGGSVITAAAGFTSIVSNGKTVNAVLSLDTDSLAGYHEFCEILSAKIDCDSIAPKGIETWRHRFCRIINPEIFNASLIGIHCQAVAESTSYQLLIENPFIYYNKPNVSPNQGYVLTGTYTRGIYVQNATDYTIEALETVNYNVGYEDDASCGANYLSSKSHVWTRPPHCLLAGYIIRSNSNVLTNPYADSPVVRSSVTPDNLAGVGTIGGTFPQTNIAYGFVLIGTTNTLISPSVFANPTLDGVSRAYSQDLQIAGIHDAGGSNNYLYAKFTGGSVTKRIGSGFNGANIGTSEIQGPRYSNTSSGIRVSSFQDGFAIRKGGSSQSCLVTNFNDGTGFGATATDYSAYPSPNGATGTRQSYQDFQKTVGTTGLSAIRFYNATADGNVTPSDQINHQFGLKSLGSFLAHSKAAEFPLIRVGVQSALVEPAALPGTSRQVLSNAVLSVERPTVFDGVVMLPRYTTAQKNALAAEAQPGAIVFDTTTEKPSFTANGSVWTDLGSPSPPVRVTVASTLPPGNYELSSTGGAFTITLAPGAGKWQFYNADLSSATNNITIVAGGSPTFTDATGAQSSANYTLNIGGTESTIQNTDGGSTYYVTVTGRPSVGGSAEPMIAQTAHGLVLGQPVRVNSSGVYVAANADSQANLAGLVGVVSQVVDANSFKVARMGQQVNGLTGLIPGSTYFVPATGAALVATAPIAPNFVAPIAMAVSATSVNVGVFAYQAGV